MYKALAICMALAFFAIQPTAGQSCDENEVALCDPLLTQCLLEHPLSKDGACNCYEEYGKCFLKSNCFNIPYGHYYNCYEYLKCARSQCEGSGSYSTPFSIVAIVALVLATMKLT